MKLVFGFVFCIGVVLAVKLPEFQHEDTSTGNRLYYFVINDENSEIVNILKKGANVVIKFIDEHTPFHVSTSEDNAHARTTSESITVPSTEESIEINSIDRRGYTPLFLAVMDGHYNIVEILLQMGANPNIRHTKSGRAALHVAVELGFESIVDALIKHHADVNIIDKNDDSPLSIALKNGHKTIAASLIENGAHIEPKGDTSILAVIGCIAQNASTHFLDALTRIGIHTESDWKNALKDAIKKDDTLSTELLIKNCAEDLKEIQEPWPLHYAAERGYVDVVEVLLENGANVNAVDSYGNTPLHWSAFSGKVDVAKILIKNGAQINAKDANGYTPMHMACHQGKADFVRVLIQNGAEINAKSLKGNTPIHMAAYYGYPDVAQILIDNSADTKIQNNAGATALSLAESQGKTPIVNILRNKE